jgi:hypothetical protein
MLEFIAAELQQQSAELEELNKKRIKLDMQTAKQIVKELKKLLICLALHKNICILLKKATEYFVDSFTHWRVSSSEKY